MDRVAVDSDAPLSSLLSSTVEWDEDRGEAVFLFQQEIVSAEKSPSEVRTVYFRCKFSVSEEAETLIGAAK